MIAYIDASVLLRLVFDQTERLREWREIDLGVASALVEVECLRTVDRLRLGDTLSDGKIAALRAEIYRLVEELDCVEVDRSVLARASQPLWTGLGTLDAIHLATALLWRETSGEAIVMATHDKALGRAARAHGMDVVGA